MSVETRMDVVEQRLDDLEGRVGGAELKQDADRETVGSVLTGVQKLRSSMRRLREEHEGKSAKTETQLQRLEEEVAKNSTLATIGVEQAQLNGASHQKLSADFKDHKESMEKMLGDGFDDLHRIALAVPALGNVTVDLGEWFQKHRVPLAAAGVVIAAVIGFITQV